MDEKTPLPAELEPIPGDTYPLRAELKTLGAVWDPAERVWRITADRLPLATALVENQALVPPAPPLPTDASGDPLDPFEQEAETPHLIALEKSDGATYEARDTLRAVGARWDKDRRAWMIREERADYARAVLTAVAASPTAPPATPFRSVDAERSLSAAARPDKAPVLRESGGEAYTIPTKTTPQEATRPMATDRIKLGGLWLNRSKDGREYLTGKLSSTVKILIFKNDFKTTDNQPSHVMYLAPVDTEETPRQNTPVPTSFFGTPDDGENPEGAGGTGDAFSDAGVADDDFFPEEDAAPPPPAPRASRPAPAPSAPAAQPVAGNRAPPPSQAPRRPAPNSPPAQTRTPNRNPARARDDSETDDMQDPFDA